MISNRRRCIALLTAIALVTPPTTMVGGEAAAQAPAKRPKSVGDMLQGKAREQWDMAIRLAGRTPPNWDGALASFQQAHELSHNPRVLFNVAVAQKGLTRYPAAIVTLKQELADGKGILSTEEEVEIKDLIAALEKVVAKLTIEVSEPGAEIFIDGAKLPDLSPLREPVRVSLGERRVRATKAGFAEAVESVVLAGGGSEKVSLKLSALVKTSLVKVSVIGPTSAVLKIDGKEVGATMGTKPYEVEVPVSPVPHQIAAEATGYVPASQPVTVREGEAMVVTLQLAQEQQKGKLVISAKPEGAVIEIDGKGVGSTHWEGPVDTGPHQVAVKKQGYYTWSYDVDVPKGGERALSAQLNEDRNTSFLPWLIGTVLVVGGSALAIGLIVSRPDEEPVRGTLPPFAVGTQGFRW